jgi:hypothetical protein
MVFARFRQQVRISEQALTPQILRHSLALRTCRQEGIHGLPALMGYEGMALIRQYLRWHDQWVHEQMQCQPLRIHRNSLAERQHLS